MHRTGHPPVHTGEDRLFLGFIMFIFGYNTGKWRYNYEQKTEFIEIYQTYIKRDGAKDF